MPINHPFLYLPEILSLYVKTATGGGENYLASLDYTTATALR